MYLMSPLLEHHLLLTRRHFLSRGGVGLAALWSLLGGDTAPAASGERETTSHLTHFPARAKRVIYLFQSGAPSQMDLFDYKPKLRRPARHRVARLDPAGPAAHRHDLDAGRASRSRRASSALPGTADAAPGSASCCRTPRRVADDLCFVKSMHTEAINHDPAITFFQTGAQLAGRPSIGAWLTYGLGSENRDLPAFVVMISQGSGNPTDQPLYDRLWGSGFLPTQLPGRQVPLRRRSGAVPLQPRRPRRRPRAAACSTTWPSSTSCSCEETGDPEIATRIAQYEMAYRMQTVGAGADRPVERAGARPRPVRPRRRASRARSPPTACWPGGWPSAACASSSSSTAAGTSTRNLPKQIAGQCRDTDQPSAALVTDLKQRGLLDDTLVVWGGEFGRTVYCQGTLTADDYGRDHHPRCFTVWLAGGGIKPGITYGETDDYSYNIVEDPVHVHDLHATMLHCLGIDHTRLTFRFQGRDYPADRRAWEGGEGGAGVMCFPFRVSAGRS